jgi:tyrosyl-tRNA synthetase
MSKSLGNYIGINESPQEMFGKVMSISDDLMWRYYELCTDLRRDQIADLKAQAESGERNPRDIKAELAQKIITDFHSATDARHALDEFNRIFQRKEAPEEVEERALAQQAWKLPKLLVETGLAPSMAEARRLIEQGGVAVDGERVSRGDYELDLSGGRAALLQVGKRKFLRVRSQA